MRPWPDEPFSTNHLGALFVRSVARMQAVVESLLPWLRQRQPLFERSFLLKTPFGRTIVLSTLGLSLLASLPDQRSGASSPLLKEAAAVARKLSRVPGVSARGSAHLLWANIYKHQGRLEQALEHARLAQASVPGLLRPGAQYLEGLVEGGDNPDMPSACARWSCARADIRIPSSPSATPCRASHVVRRTSAS